MKENIYRVARKKAAQTNPLLNSIDTAQDVLCIDRLRLLKIENGQKLPNPEDIVSMANVYDAPELCNYYCTKECPVRCDETPLIYDDLEKISVRLMSALHFMEKANDRLFEILEDGQVSEDQRRDFVKILDTLKKVSYSADSLELWAKKNGYEE